MAQNSPLCHQWPRGSASVSAVPNNPVLPPLLPSASSHSSISSTTSSFSRSIKHNASSLRTSFLKNVFQHRRKHADHPEPPALDARRSIHERPLTANACPSEWESSFYSRSSVDSRSASSSRAKLLPQRKSRSAWLSSSKSTVSKLTFNLRGSSTFHHPRSSVTSPDTLPNTPLYGNPSPPSDSINPAPSKLSTPLDRIKQLFVDNLSLDAHSYDNHLYHMVFTGSHAIDLIVQLLGLPDRSPAIAIAQKLDELCLYEHVAGPSGFRCRSIGLIDDQRELYTLSEQAFRLLVPSSPPLSFDTFSPELSSDRIFSPPPQAPRPPSACKPNGRNSLPSSRDDLGNAAVMSPPHTHSPATASSAHTKPLASEHCGPMPGADAPPRPPRPPRHVDARDASDGDLDSCLSDPPLSANTIDSLETVEIPTYRLAHLLESWLSDDNDASKPLPGRRSAARESGPAKPPAGGMTAQPAAAASCPYLVQANDFQNPTSSNISAALRSSDTTFINEFDSNSSTSSASEPYNDEQPSHQPAGQLHQLRPQRPTEACSRPSSTSSVSNTIAVRKDGTASGGTSPQQQQQPTGGTHNVYIRSSANGSGASRQPLASPVHPRGISRSESMINLLRPCSITDLRGGQSTCLRRAGSVSASLYKSPTAAAAAAAAAAVVVNGRPRSMTSACVSSNIATFLSALDIPDTAVQPLGFAWPSTPSTAATLKPDSQLTSTPAVVGLTTVNIPASDAGTGDHSCLKTKPCSIFTTTLSDYNISYFGKNEWTPVADRISSAQVAMPLRGNPPLATSDTATAHAEPTPAFTGVVSRAPLWKHTVPHTILASLSPEIISWQESIYEVIGTERDYVHDMRLIDTIFVEPLLRRDDIIPANTVGAKIWEIFYNYSEALQINDRLCAALCSLQEKHHTMPGIGGPFMEWTKNLEPLVAYSVHVPEAQAEIECEMARNPEFAKFVADAESHPDSRKLPLQSFVGRPAARLARYTLLLDAVLKHTPADNPDRALLPVVISKVKDVLARIDRLTGERANYVRIKKLRAQLKSGSGFDVRALCLDDPKRKLVHGGLLYQSDGQRVMTFLLDHVLLFAAEHKVAHAKGVSEYTVLREPVPIHLLDVISSADSAGGHSGHQSGGTATVGRRMLTRAGLLRPNTVASSLGGTSGSSGSPLPSCATPITFHKLGPNGWSQLLLAGNAQEREQWVEVVRKRIAADDMGLTLDIALKPLSETDFIAPNAPLCSASFRSPTTGCMMVMFGAMDGLYMGLAHKPTSVRRICKLGNVSSVHVFEAFDMVIALTNGRLLAYHLNELEDPDNWGREVRGVQLAANIAYTAAGRYLRRPLLVYARVHRNRTKFKCVQPFNSTESSAHAADAKRGRLYHNKKHRLDVIQEFWIGCETFGVHFFRKKLCVVCRESFEIVDIRRGYENFGLPNPLDPDLRFVQGSGGRPLAIHRIGAEFLLCFERLAFYLNRAGQRTRLDFIISWLLPPRQVIVHGPYIVAFNQLFIEIRNAGTGELEHTIRAPNAVCLNGNNFPNHGIHVAAPSSSLNHIGSLLMKGEMLTSASESSPSPMSSSAFLPYLGNYMTTMSLHLQGRSSLSHRPSSASLSSSLHGSLVHLSRSQSPSLVSVPANYIVFELRLPSSSP